MLAYEFVVLTYNYDVIENVIFFISRTKNNNILTTNLTNLKRIIVIFGRLHQNSNAQLFSTSIVHLASSVMSLYLVQWKLMCY